MSLYAYGGGYYGAMTAGNAYAGLYPTPSPAPAPAPTSPAYAPRPIVNPFAYFGANPNYFDPQRPPIDYFHPQIGALPSPQVLTTAPAPPPVQVPWIGAPRSAYPPAPASYYGAYGRSSTY